jgi:hypothetical protein
VAAAGLPTNNMVKIEINEQAGNNTPAHYVCLFHTFVDQTVPQPDWTSGTSELLSKFLCKIPFLTPLHLSVVGILKGIIFAARTHSLTKQ